MSRDLFEWIEMEPVQFWHSLLYMDQVRCQSFRLEQLASPGYFYQSSGTSTIAQRTA